MLAAHNAYIIAHPATFIQYSVLNMAARTDAQLWNAALLVLTNIIERFKRIIAHHVGVDDDRPVAHARADAHHGIFDACGGDDRAFGNNGMIERGAAHLGWRQHARPRKYGALV